MLIRFNVSNFLSFNNEQEFSMLPGKVEKFRERLIKTKNINLLKFCALYGANSSGKSNLIKAIDIAKKIIVGEYVDASDKFFCKFNRDNKKKPSKFEFEISLENKYYAYGFNICLSSFTIINEWLYEITPTDEKPIYERDMENNIFRDNVEFAEKNNKSKFNVYAEDIMNMSNVLFLSEIKRKKLHGKDFQMFNDIYDWFENRLNIIYPDTVIGSFLRMFDSNKETNTVNLLNYFDTGITDYVLESSSEEQLKKFMNPHEYEEFSKILRSTSNKVNEESKIKSAKGSIITDKHIYDVKYENDIWEYNELLFKHGSKCDLLFDFGEESDGTRRLIQLLDVIHSDNDKNTFIIDELDRSLHPQMTRKFIETFFKITKGRKIQLFISTHESNLLDLEFLRRDEVWFVERDEDYSSKLYSLENFKVRYDKKIDKAYLEGRYGAVPLFKHFESYIEV